MKSTLRAPPAPLGARLLSKREVLAIVSVSYPALWSMMRAGTFPRSRVTPQHALIERAQAMPKQGGSPEEGSRTRTRSSGSIPARTSLGRPLMRFSASILVFAAD
jgi:hypothetical protein